MVTISLHGKAVLVTGGASKIGGHIVRTMTGAGASVVFTYQTNEARARAVAEEAGAKAIVRADTRKPHECTRAVNAAVKNLKGLDILVNNAGIWMGAPFDEITEKDMEALIETNLTGTMLMSRAAIPVMKKKKQGNIINLATSVRNIMGKGNVSYGASKSGVIGFTKALARELGPFGIRVNAVSPGWIPTVGEYRDILSRRREKGPEISLPIGKPEYIADAVLFFASDLSRYITGEVLNVHGSGS